MLLKGKVAVVTGGSRGLGRVDALALAEAGANVVIADILMEGAEKTAKEIQAMGKKSFAIKMDVTNMEEVKEGAVRIKNELGSIDILVNSAATLDHLGQLLEQKDKLWERDLRVNLTGTFNCSRAVWPYMKEKSWGRIINMASVAGTIGGFGQASYSTTKAGIIGFTKTMALEGARYGITCNVVCPGVINSESFNLIPQEMRERLIKRTAFRKPGEPEDVAHAIVFLSSDKAKYITGIVLNVSGGIELFTPLEIMPRCSAAGLDFRIIPAGFNAPLEFLTGFTF
ncbi:MAG: 3-oxoacyl-ACP reductase family protein [Thermodesulfobacteriota bacterium]|nr:3-oxoacyl-ACP reductase family protein [Thermodesulfobacteriota bacterium]